MPSSRSKPPRTRSSAQNAVARSGNPPDTLTNSPGNANQFAGFEYREQTSGYLIPPMMIEGYERRIANFGERWFTMVEQQDEHRRELERHTIFDDGRRAWAGVICGFVLCMTALIVALILGLNRHDAGGTILSGVIGTSGIVGLAWVFIHGTKVRRQEREDKARIMMGQQVPPR